MMPDPSPSGVEPYVYTPLENPTQQIRLIRVLCRDSSGAIHCDLQAFPIDNLPEYLALSYMWGPPTSEYSILVDGKRLNIRENLFHFLEEFCHIQHEYIWIDQISINQGDVQERGQQVGLMGKIYRQTTCCVIWLGNDERYPQAARNILAGPDIDPETLHESYLQLIRDPYFTRLWIVQEFLLPKAVVFLIRRDIRIGWPDMRASLPDLKILGKTGIHRDVESLFLLHRRGMEKLDPKQLIQDISMYSFCMACQEPLDKIYGLLGLSETPVPVEVDYTRSIRCVFNDLLRYAFQIYLLDPGEGEPNFTSQMDITAKTLELEVSGDLDGICRRASADLLLLSGQKDFKTMMWDVRLELDDSGNVDRTRPRGEWVHLVRDKLLVKIDGETLSYYCDWDTKEVVVTRNMEVDGDA